MKHLEDLSKSSMKFIMLQVISDNVLEHHSAIEKAKQVLISEIEKFTNSQFTKDELRVIEDSSLYIQNCVDIINGSDTITTLFQGVDVNEC